MLFFIGCTFNSTKSLGAKSNKELMLETQLRFCNISTHGSEYSYSGFFLWSLFNLPRCVMIGLKTR